MTAQQFFPTPIRFDRSLYMVVRHFGDLGMESHTNPDDTRESIVADIVTGQIDRVVAVIEVNPVEGWSRNCTAEIKDMVEVTKMLRAAE